MRTRLLTVVALLSLASAAGADVLYNNLGPGDSYNATGGVTVSAFQNVGVRFMPTSAATPTDIVVAMKSTNGGTVTLAICSEVANRPGTVLATTTVDVLPGDPDIYAATFDAPPQLTAGVNYWIRASGSPATWMPNVTGVTGYAFTLASGAWNQSTAGATPAVRLEDNLTPPPLTGACCAGSTCVLSLPTMCNALHTRFAGPGTSCNAAGNTATPCCKADFNQSGGVEVQDVFDYLNAWFAGDLRADINGGGLSVQDIFDFLAAWFGGC